MEEITQQPASAVVRYYWRHAAKYKGSLVALAILLPITSITGQVAPPIILAHVLNRLSKGDYIAHDPWRSFGPWLVAFAVLEILSSLVVWRLIDHFVWRLEGRVSRDMAREVFGHLTSQTADFHANHFGGSLVSQTNKLLGSYVRIADVTIFQVIPLVLGVLFSVLVLMRSTWQFGVILLAFSVFYSVSAVFVTRATRVLGAKHATLESQQTGLLADAITNVMAIKSFAGKVFENKRFAKATNETFDGLIRLANAHQRQQAYFGGMLGIVSAMSLTVAVISVLNFHADVAAVFLIFSYTGSVAEQLFQFSNSSLRGYNRAVGDAGDMVSILASRPEVVDPAKPHKAHITRGDIRFDNVTFKHKGADDAIFDQLNVHIKPGEKVGLVGHSGSGKTTLTRILLRFSDIQSGAITIDGQNIAEITQDDLHRHVAYVPQEPLLFHRTIAENIRYGDPSASDEAVRAVAKMASAHDFVNDLPNGYDTLVGERGVKLSGGQRQRIVIARALLKNAPVLVLDEATSALDSESEVLIQAALWKLMESRTAIVIAHRLSTIQKMDRILVLDHGQVKEQGSHKELLAQKGIYAKLWAHQSGGFLDD